LPLSSGYIKLTVFREVTKSVPLQISKENFEVSTFVTLRTPFFWNTTLHQLATVPRLFLVTSKAMLFNFIFFV